VKNKHPDYWQEACIYLTKNDAVMAQLIANFPHEKLTTRGDAFYSLMRSIVGQQVSVKAADSMWNKLENLVKIITPEEILKKTEEELRSCGLSRQKISYAKNLSEAFVNKQIQPKHFAQMDDEAITKQLTNIKGIGSWTAEMFLIFHLLRPNILPVKDIGLYKAVQKYYPAANITLGKEPWPVADIWQPYRTVATWYLWRALDPVVVSY
jgi:DNA-3-methyladenine glycosylase II